MSQTTALVPTDRIATAESLRAAGLFAIALVVVLGLAVAGPVGVAAAQEDNETATATTTVTETQTPTETSTECEPSDDAPSLDRARLYAPEPTIDAGDPGQIAGGFQLSGTMNCPVTVQITMSIPSGMTISGSSDVVSGGAGMVTATFEVEPGEIRDIRADVYASNTGEYTVTGDVTYWPTGHEDMARELDGFSETFQVEEPVTQSAPQTTTSPDDGGAGADGTDGIGPLGQTSTLVVAGGFGILVLAIVAIVAMRSGKVNIGVSN